MYPYSLDHSVEDIYCTCKAYVLELSVDWPIGRWGVYIRPQRKSDFHVDVIYIYISDML